MNEKTMRYIGLGVGVLLTLITLYAGAYFEVGHFSKRGVSYVFGLNKELSNILWYLCFLVGFWLSWKYRFKTAKIVNKIFTKIHKKV